MSHAVVARPVRCRFTGPVQDKRHFFTRGDIRRSRRLGRWRAADWVSPPVWLSRQTTACCSACRSHPLEGCTPQPGETWGLSAAVRATTSGPLGADPLAPNTEVRAAAGGSAAGEAGRPARCGGDPVLQRGRVARRRSERWTRTGPAETAGGAGRPGLDLGCMAVGDGADVLRWVPRTCGAEH